MPTAHSWTRSFLSESFRYMRPETFQFLRTSRTVKTVKLSQTDLEAAVARGKFERCSENVRHPLPDGVHGVNLFTVYEAKGRRRLITESHLNGVIRKSELPSITRLSRLERRQRLRFARYMFQLDFEAFYDAIPLPEEIRDKFVFRARDGGMYRLKTLPTGARWSVAVGQAVTWTIVDIDTPVFIETMIDNILVAAAEGQEAAFVSAVRQIVGRIRQANLLTSPERETVASWTDEELLCEGRKGCVFWGEEFAWMEGQRQVRNSIKTVTKLDLAAQKDQFTIRSFASLVSLISYA
ncbi:TATE DNA Transposon, partial [Leptomonas pyrrhocoris]